MRWQLTKFSVLQWLLFCFVVSLNGCTKEIISNDEGHSFIYSPKQIAPGVVLGEVYKTDNFASFTDITYFNHSWYIIFRAGTEHLHGLKGQIKIIKSNDGINWKVQPIIINDSLDLRDPKFVIDSLNNELYLNYTGIKYLGNSSTVYGFMAVYNTASQTWSKPQLITHDSTAGEQFVFWRLTYSKGKMYSAAYRSPVLGGYTIDDLSLFDNKDNYTDYIPIGKLNLGNSPSETTIRFDHEGKMYLLVRRETANVALGKSLPSSYTDVTWTEPIKVKLSSPNFLFYNEKLLMCGRDQDKLTFKFFSYNLSTNKKEKEFTFPSGIETGYGGMSFNPDNQDELLISYYVIASGKSYIYLVRMDLKTFLQ